MSGLANPLKNFRYILELDGVNMFHIQEVTPPKVEYQEIQHGAPINIPNAKMPGKMVVGDLVVKKLRPATQGDTWAWDWFGAAVAGIRKDFVKTGFLKDLGPEGLQTVQTWVLGDIWPKSIESSNRMAMGNENVIETVTFACQFYYPRESSQLQALLAGSAARAGGIAFLLGVNS